jgi:2'-5' RNA ligase
LPPHVTVLYPFVGARRIDGVLVRALEEVLQEFPAFDFALTRLDRFPGVLYAAPDPPAPFISITEACVRRWPDHPPFGGAFETIVPHLTIEEADVPESESASFAARLPVLARAREVVLMTPGRGGTWSRRAAIPLPAPDRPRDLTSPPA